MTGLAYINPAPLFTIMLVTLRTPFSIMFLRPISIRSCRIVCPVFCLSMTYLTDTCAVRVHIVIPWSYADFLIIDYLSQEESVGRIMRCMTIHTASGIPAGSLFTKMVFIFMAGLTDYFILIYILILPYIPIFIAIWFP